MMARYVFKFDLCCVYENRFPENSDPLEWCYIADVSILDLYVSHVGGEVQKNILSILLLAPASVGEQYCLASPKRLVASQECAFHETC